MNVTTGANTNPGTETLPWKTITHATQTAPVNAKIHIAAGTYNSLETAPIMPRNGQQLIGTGNAPTTQGNEGNYSIRSIGAGGGLQF